MKKALLIFGIIVLTIILAIAAIPYVFKSQLLDLTKKEMNKNLIAKVDFKDFDVSIFRSFPDLTISLEELEIVGSGQFKRDTLAAIETLRATVDIMSVLNGDSIALKEIILQKPRLHVLYAADGAANFDIMKPTTEVAPVDTSTTAFAMKLEHIEIIDGYVHYGDIPASMFATLENINMVVTGNFSDNSTIIKTDLSVDKLSYTMDMIPFLTRVKCTANAEIAADFIKEKFTFTNNKVLLNSLELVYNGWFGFDKDDMLMDIKFKTAKSDFKNILSLVPGMFMEEFEDIKTSGNLIFEGFVKGRMSDKPESYPSFNFKMLVDNASFKYPDLPKAVTNINIDLLVSNNTNSLNNTIIDLRKLNLQFASNPISATFYMANPMTDPFIKTTLDGTLTLQTLKDFIPLQDMSLEGVITPHLQLECNVSDIEKENYSAIKADGTLAIANFVYKDVDYPKGIKITKAHAAFSPQYVTLDNCSILFGKSDLQLSGKLENFLAYALANQTIKGVLNVQSTYFNATDVMGTDTTTVAATDTTTSTAPITIPSNIDFVCKIAFGHLLYDTYDIKNLKGTLSIKNSKANLENLTMNMLGGTLGLQGYYSTPANSKPDAKFALDIKNFDLAQTYKTFVTVQQIAPIAKYLQGSFSTKFDFSSKLENSMMPDLSSINGFGEIKSPVMGMKQTSLQTFMVNSLKQDKFKSLDIKDILMFFTIENGNITIKPFETTFNKNKTLIEGKTSLNKTLDFKVAMQLPRTNLGSLANTALGSLEKAAASQNINSAVGEFIDVTLLITGDISKPKFKPVLGNATSGVFNSVKDQAKQRLEQEKARLKAEAESKIAAAKAEAEAKAKAEIEKQKQVVKTKANAEIQKQTDAAKQKAKEKLNILRK